jgi:hypothetical protein
MSNMRIKRTHRWKVQRKPDGEWQHATPAPHMKVGNARGFAATLLNLPLDAICLLNRNGRAARSDKRIGDLRKEWFGK